MQILSHNWNFCILPELLGFWESDTEVLGSSGKQQLPHDQSVLHRDTGVLIWKPLTWLGATSNLNLTKPCPDAANTSNVLTTSSSLMQSCVFHKRSYTQIPDKSSQNSLGVGAGRVSDSELAGEAGELGSGRESQIQDPKGMRGGQFPRT